MTTSGEAPNKALGAVDYLDARTGAAGFLRRNLRKVFPDHWTFLLGEVALYSFIILLLTGTFLTFWYKPGMNDVVYSGSYLPLRGVTMSEAYASTLHLSFDVRGGLLMRQIHHWAALLFVAGIFAHMLRIFFTGAYRKPREFNWIIGVILLTIALLEGLTGYSLPDDLLSGAGLRITQGVILSIPIIGTYLSFFIFGGEYPGEDIISRFYTVHILLFPGILVALVSAHLMLMWVQKHTQMPGTGRTDRNVIGAPLYPAFMLKSGAFFAFTFAVLAGLGTLTQINPVWLYGPYTPSDVSAGSQPDFYLGFLEGSLRMMPSWEIDFLGHTLSLSVLIPGLVPLGLIITGLLLYPFAERWVTGDNREHHVAERPRDNPHRTSIGMAAVTFYGVLWLVGASDEISANFHVPLYHITWAGRILVFLGPVIAYYVTYRICVGLQRKEAEILTHGVESGVIRLQPHGEFDEVHVPASEEMADRILGKQPVPMIDGDGDGNGEVPSRTSRGPIGRLRARMSQAYGGEKVPLEEERERRAEIGSGAKDRRDG